MIVMSINKYISGKRNTSLNKFWYPFFFQNLAIIKKMINPKMPEIYGAENSA
jgi:hypothetical protein